MSIFVGYKTESLHKFMYEKYDDEDTSPDMFPKVCNLFTGLYCLRLCKSSKIRIHFKCNFLHVDLPKHPKYYIIITILHFVAG